MQESVYFSFRKRLRAFYLYKERATVEAVRSLYINKVRDYLITPSSFTHLITTLS